MSYPKYTYPAAEIVCDCPAFPWPHAEFLSRRCATQHFYEAHEPTELSEVEENRRLDYTSRWKEMQ
jgi:hypothetical protein